MSKVGIVSDSNCDLPVEVIKELDIFIVPGKIIFGDDEVRKHYVDITYEEFYHRLVHDKEMPSTSVPSLKDYQKVYEEALQKYDEIIVFCTSSKMSSMYNNAELVAKQFFKEKTTVIDSQTITLPMGVIVSQTAKKAREDFSKDELIKLVKEHLIPNTHVFGGIPTLTYLQKGGRIGKVKSIMGNLLQQKPVITIENGELVPLGKVRGMDNVYKVLLDYTKKLISKQQLDFLIVGHTADPETAQKLTEEIKAIPKAPKNIQMIEVGPSVGTHLGPGGLMIAWIGDFDKKLLNL